MSKLETITGSIGEWEDYLRSLGDDSSSDEANRSPAQSPTTPPGTTTATGSTIMNPPSSPVLPPSTESPSGVRLSSSPLATSKSRTNFNLARRGLKPGLAKRQTSNSDSEDDESQTGGCTTKDEKILQASCTNELRLWGRSLDLFGCDPYKLIPQGLSVEISAESQHMADAQAPYVFWSESFCIKLTLLITIPAIRGNMPLLHYAIDKAYNYRLGKTSTTIPIPYQESDEGGVLPEHFEFLKYLESEVESYQRSMDSKKLVTRDIGAIIRAWDCYAEKNGLNLAQEALKEYRNNLGRPGFQLEHTRDYVLAAKKEWMMRCKQELNSQGSRRTTSKEGDQEVDFASEGQSQGNVEELEGETEDHEDGSIRPASPESKDDEGENYGVDQETPGERGKRQYSELEPHSPGPGTPARKIRRTNNDASPDDSHAVFRGLEVSLEGAQLAGTISFDHHSNNDGQVKHVQIHFSTTEYRLTTIQD